MTSSSPQSTTTRLRGKLVCPECKASLDVAARGGELACPSCNRRVRVTGDRYDFGGLTVEEEKSDWLNEAKAKAKRKLGRFYPLAMELFAPVYGDSGIDTFVRGFGDDAVVCDLGCGTRNRGGVVVGVDGYPYEGVNVVCNLEKLPFADGSVDGIISEAVLEHVPNPAAHVAEMRRVLRPGGRVLCYFPFMAAFHASPHDYTRLTQPGLRQLFDGWQVDAMKVAGGPTSGLLWTFQEWLAMVGSFGNEKLYRLLVPLTWVTSPLKYFDAILIKHPAAHVIASGFVIEATKP